MNSAPEPHSARPVATGRTTVRLVTLLVLCTLLGMSLDPCASAARGAEPRPAVSTVPEPLGEGHHDTAMAAQSASARAGRGAGPGRRTGRRAAPRPPYGGAFPPSRKGPAAPPAARCVVLRC
ncbi:hypothetical protein GCM10011583_48490 [Streptomyces camponoticapitis]|uniref:Secreted protein n=1 Tax=Streptomyces camponoticapitis TaxID=1616125 RepID=A0ABQ2EFN1_9ACTN|nr:hypothetical protein [Streptomyces camponoticapitis]GGK10665.1 hypothetical protein GCM10011583_48490 [Streptomyces camponoticapitis]